MRQTSGWNRRGLASILKPLTTTQDSEQSVNNLLPNTKENRPIKGEVNHRRTNRIENPH